MKMKSVFGVAKELKKDESRVSLTPDSVKFLTEHNHTIYVETNCFSSNEQKNQSLK